MKIIRKMLAGKGAMLVLVCSFFAFLACGKKGENGAGADNPSPNIKLVKIMPVKAEALQGTVAYVGTLSANLKVNVATEMGGTIEKIFFERGDRVKKGQVLAEVSTGSIRIYCGISTSRSRIRSGARISRTSGCIVASRTWWR